MNETYIPGFSNALTGDAMAARAQAELDRMRALQAMVKPVAAAPVAPEATSLGGLDRMAAFNADAAKLFADANANAEAANRRAEEERAIKNAQVQALSELYTGADPFGYSTNLYNDPAALAAEIQRVNPALANVNTLAAAQALQAQTLADRQALWNLGLDTSRAAEAIDRYAEGLNLQPGSRIEGVANSLYKSGVPQELLDAAKFSADPRERKAALDQLQQYVTSPAEQNVNLEFTPFIKGKGIRGDVTVGPNTPVALYDASTGQVVSMGSGFDSARSVAEQAQKLSDTMGREANWQIMVGAPGATDISQFKTVAGELPDKSFMGQFADMALPALGAILVPGLGALGALGSAGAAGVGAAAGSALSGVAQGKSVGDILKNAAISGALAYGGGSLFGNAPSPTSALEKGATAAGSSLGSGTGTLAAKAAEVAGGNVITVLGRAGLAPAIAGAGTGALAGGALNSVLNNSLWNTPIDKAAQQPTGGGGYNAPAAGLDDAGNLITVTGSKLPSSALDSALAAAAAAPGTVNYGDKVYGKEPTLEQRFNDTFGGNDIVVTGGGTSVPPAVIAGGAAAGATGALSGGALPEGTGPDIIAEGQRPVEPNLPAAGVGTGAATIPEGTGADIVVTGNNPPTKLPDALDTVLATTPLLSGATPAPTTPAEPVDDKGLSTSDYIRLASLGISTIGKLFGGSGQQQGATISGAMSGLNPVFSKQLPTANIPGLTAATAGARAPSQSGLNTTQDWYRYGYGPEQSFFNYVPMAQPNTSQAYTGYAEGGFAVEGAGDGRDDKIPAMLSDGEYVIDAETVALLGNGSSKAGADLLDKFRVNVRKHKGQQLAKGEFSDDAKRPEHYLAGGRM